MKNVARDPVEAYFISMSAFHEDEKQQLLNPDVLKTLNRYSTSEWFHNIYKTAPAKDHLSRLQYLDIKMYLCEDILTKVDRASMAVSLEVRCPLLDHVFMEYVARIPSKLKRVGTDGKHLFKKALKEYLPHDILYREKMGFGVPILEWLRSDLREYSRNLIFDGSASHLYFQRNYLKKIWDQHQTGIRDSSEELWTIMMLNLWYDRFARRK
jgi:asparagine synthase (glutamine-hydrolysing)